jgi:hypothetical protein
VTCQTVQHDWPPLPEGRAGATAAILDGDVYLVGGYGIDGLTARVQVLSD